MLEYLFIYLIVLQLLDGYTTIKILSSGGTELNPLIRKLIDSIGIAKGIILVKILAVVLGYLLLTMGQTSPLIFLAILYSLVVANNLYNLYK